MPKEDKQEDFEKFVISQKAILIRNGRCLIFEDAKHPGYWDLPGGRIEKGEPGVESFRREISEELGLSEFELGQTIDHAIWYNDKGQAICGIAILIQNEQDEIIKSAEHNLMEWVNAAELDNYNFLWPEFMPRMIRKGLESITN